jgi:uncharacterized DUF497 family protein
MDCEWDEAKAASNLRKHGIDFADAAGIFDDPFALSMPDDDADEERCIAIGSDFLGRVLVVVYAYRGESIRVISARKATPTERNVYEEGLR